MNIRKIIREQLEIILNEVDLKSKSDKGNRTFEKLKTAKFQHYDMPKGELSDFSNDEDRKRLISKLSKEDKKKYREWIKTEDGKKSLEIWDLLTKHNSI